MRPYYVPDFMVKIEGLTLEADVTNAVIDLTYDNNLDTADMFRLTLNNADLRFTDSALFDVGKEVEIHMGYAGDLQPMMLGEITAVSPSFPQGGAPTLAVTGYDKSHRMRHNQPARFTFKYVNDSAIAAQIAAENLLVPIVDPSPMPPRQCVQQTGSDWALLQDLADRNFFQVYVHWDRLYFRAPRPQTEMVVLEWGKNLSSFSPRVSTAALPGMQVVRSYNQMLAQTIVTVLPAVALGDDLDDIIERLGSTIVDQLAGLGRSVIRDQPVDNHLEAAVLAKSVLKQLLDGLYEGRGACIGNPRLRAGDLIEIRGVGKRFGGEYRLRQVTHTVGEGGYQTQFEVSQKYTTTLLQSLRKKLQDDTKEQGKVSDIRIATIVDNRDPLGLGRVKVHFPDLSDENESCWIPLSTPMAGSPLEVYALPDEGEQVWVGFRNGNINEPVVLGGHWNHAEPPPVRARDEDPQNHIRLIKTKAGHAIKFDDTPDAPKIIIQDQAEQTITLDSTPDKEQIVIQDKAGSTITLHPDGKVSIEAAGDLELKAPNGDVNIDSNNVNVSVSGTMDVS